MNAKDKKGFRRKWQKYLHLGDSEIKLVEIANFNKVSTKALKNNKKLNLAA